MGASDFKLIDAALAEQTSAYTLLAQSVERVSRMSEEIAEAAESTATHTGEFDALAQSLQESIGRFRLVAA